MTPLLPVEVVGKSDKFRKRKLRKDESRAEIFDATSEPEMTETSIEPLIDLIPTISSQTLDDVDVIYHWQQQQQQQYQQHQSEEVELQVSHILFKFLFLKMGQPRPLFNLFSSSQTHITNFTANV